MFNGVESRTQATNFRASSSRITASRSHKVRPDDGWCEIRAAQISRTTLVFSLTQQRLEFRWRISQTDRAFTVNLHLLHATLQRPQKFEPNPKNLLLSLFENQILAFQLVYPSQIPRFSSENNFPRISVP